MVATPRSLAAVFVGISFKWVGSGCQGCCGARLRCGTVGGVGGVGSGGGGVGSGGGGVGGGGIGTVGAVGVVGVGNTVNTIGVVGVVRCGVRHCIGGHRCSGQCLL